MTKNPSRANHVRVFAESSRSSSCQSQSKVQPKAPLELRILMRKITP